MTGVTDRPCEHRAYHINVGRGTMTTFNKMSRSWLAYHLNVGRGTMTAALSLLCFHQRITSMSVEELWIRAVNRQSIG